MNHPERNGLESVVKIISGLILAVSLIRPASAFDYSVLRGEWMALHAESEGETSFYYLCVRDDLTGTLAWSFSGREPSIFRFESSSVIQRDGYVEIQLDNRNPPGFRAIFSGWKAPGGGRGKLAGLIYIYGSEGTVYNMHYAPLDLVSAHAPLPKPIAEFKRNTLHDGATCGGNYE